MRDLISYEGKTVVVTGAASGIGAATAELVGDLGARVIGLNIKEPAVAGVSWIRTDLGDEASMQAAVTALPDRVNALFQCAGIANIAPGPQVMAVNFLGPRLLTEGVVTLMAPGAAIASVSSVSGVNFHPHVHELGALLATPDFSSGLQWCEAHAGVVADGYELSKQAITFYTLSRSTALLAEGIRINCIAQAWSTPR